MKTREEVLRLVEVKLRLRRYSENTIDAYRHWVGRYYDFCLEAWSGDPAERKVEAFLRDLALRQRVAAGTQNQAFSAVLYLYKEVLEKPLGDVHALRAKRPIKERVAPSVDQVRQLRAAVVDTPGTPARLIVDLLYGCGLRVGEPINLRVRDVLWGEGPRGHLLIRGAKGGKDRRVPLPRVCVAPLHNQMERARVLWNYDRANFPGVGVPLPGGLARKYPSAPFLWPWFWVFPAESHCTDPQDGRRVRFRLQPDCVQRAVLMAARRTGLEGVVTPHVLRHAYATHSRESLESLRILMGHTSIETTAGYMHPVVNTASNPLDDLLGADPQVRG